MLRCAKLTAGMFGCGQFGLLAYCHAVAEGFYMVVTGYWLFTCYFDDSINVRLWGFL